MDKQPKPGWRIKLSNQTEKGLVVNADTEERAHELALQWANDPSVSVVSCKRIPDDDIIVVEGDRWTPGEKR
jgi:hypothetical protein